MLHAGPRQALQCGDWLWDGGIKGQTGAVTSPTDLQPQEAMTILDWEAYEEMKLPVGAGHLGKAGTPTGQSTEETQPLRSHLRHRERIRNPLISSLLLPSNLLTAPSRGQTQSANPGAQQAHLCGLFPGYTEQGAGSEGRWTRTATPTQDFVVVFQNKAL